MTLLLNWRLWAALGLAACLAFTHLTAYRSGKANVKAEWVLSVAAANAESLRLERARQSAVDSAGKLAAAREVGIAADAARARGAVVGLRGAVESAERKGAQSLAAANDAARVLGDLLQSCSAEYRSVAEDADRATSEAMNLRQAWPR